MTEHRLTISATNGSGPAGRPCPIGIPTLHLAGPWLEEAGFPIGAEVAVEVVEPGSLLVTRVKGEAEAGGGAAAAAGVDPGRAARPAGAGGGGGRWLSGG